MVGKGLKARNTSLEGDTFEYITGFNTITHMGEAIKNPVTVEFTEAIKQLAIANGATAAVAAAAAAAAPAAAPAAAAPAAVAAAAAPTPLLVMPVRSSSRSGRPSSRQSTCQ